MKSYVQNGLKKSQTLELKQSYKLLLSPSLYGLHITGQQTKGQVVGTRKSNFYLESQQRKIVNLCPGTSLPELEFRLLFIPKEEGIKWNISSSGQPLKEMC